MLPAGTLIHCGGSRAGHNGETTVILANSMQPATADTGPTTASQTEQHAGWRDPQAAKTESGQHRRCFRCARRTDYCTARGCLPYDYEVDEKEYADFKKALAALDKHERSRRHASDCVDVSIASSFARKCHKNGQTKLAVVSCCIMAQYGNNLQTWSKMMEARTTEGAYDWSVMQKISWIASICSPSKRPAKACTAGIVCQVVAAP